MEITRISFLRRHTRITVRFRHHLYSPQLPNLAPSLLQMLPSLREHFCENRHNRPFVDEIADTELGHVFEHVMLAILAQRDIRTSGLTTWNWHRDPLGTYHICLRTSRRVAVKESVLVAQALFTNLMHGPVLNVALPETALTTEPFPVIIKNTRRRLTFATASDHGA